MVWYHLNRCQKKEMLIMSIIDGINGEIAYLKLKKLSKGLTDYENERYEKLKVVRAREEQRRQLEISKAQISVSKDVKIKSLTA